MAVSYVVLRSKWFSGLPPRTAARLRNTLEAKQQTQRYVGTVITLTRALDHNREGKRLRKKDNEDVLDLCFFPTYPVPVTEQKIIS